MGSDIGDNFPQLENNDSYYYLLTEKQFTKKNSLGKENLPQASPNVKCDNLNHWISWKFSMHLGQKKNLGDHQWLWPIWSIQGAGQPKQN